MTLKTKVLKFRESEVTRDITPTSDPFKDIQDGIQFYLDGAVQTLLRKGGEVKLLSHATLPTTNDTMHYYTFLYKVKS